MNHVPNIACIGCGGRFSDSQLVITPCNHKHCHECILMAFAKSLGDDTLFPPRCCDRAIPLGTVKSYITRDMVREFREKEVARSTRDFTICHDPSCSALIQRGTFNFSTVTCPKCRKRTCRNCNGEGHIGPCPKDALDTVLTLAHENGWKRCYSCHEYVEREDGGNHISMSPRPLLNEWLTCSVHLLIGF